MADKIKTNTSFIREAFSRDYMVVINAGHIRRLGKLIQSYELRRDHPFALHTALLGVHRSYFLDSDVEEFFDVFGVDHREFARTVKECEGIVQEYKVSSNPFNIFCGWILHLIMRSNMPIKMKLKGVSMVTQYLQYKFFSSVVGNNLKYTPNEDIMRATIESLSGKYYIRKPATPTWFLVMKKRSTEIALKNSNHYDTIMKFGDDGEVRFLISDLETSLRNKLVAVTSVFYNTHEKNSKIVSTSITVKNEGETFMRALDAKYDQMVNGVTSSCLNIRKFVDNKSVGSICTFSQSGVREDMMRKLLIAFSDVASQQSSKKHGDSTKKLKAYDSELLVGYHVLVSKIIQVTFAYIRRSNPSGMKSVVDILTNVKNIYRSSRVLEPGIVQIKDSVSYIIDNAHVTNRDATKSALRVNFLLYIILIAIKQL